MRHALPVGTVAAAVLLMPITAGCRTTSPEPKPQQPSVSAFLQGPCRGMAPDVLTIGRQAGNLGTSTSPPQQSRDALKAAQEHLRAQAATLDPTLKPRVQGLIEAVGIVRLQSDANSFTPALAKDLAAAYAQVLEVCISSG